MTNVHVRRLNILANFLVKVPRKRFNMRSYCTGHGCNTVCCILGWAGTIPSFRRAGLKTDVSDNSVYLHGRWVCGDTHEIYSSFFGLPDSDLFYSESLKTPKQAAKRILQLIKEGTKS